MAIQRFLYGFLSQSTNPFNIALPWRTSDQDGYFAMNYSYSQSVLDNLKAWANTNRGERPMRFSFGLDARRYLFEQERIGKAAILSNAQQQLPVYFPHVKIVELSVKSNEDDPNIPPNAIRFFLNGEVKGEPILLDAIVR